MVGRSHHTTRRARVRSALMASGSALMASVGWRVDRWDDRDRIVLLHEYILSDQPDGSYEWEMRISSRVALLWSEGREGTCEIHADGVDETASEDVRVGRMHWSDFANVEAPGWRMLSSLPSCPNSHMRFPMSQELLARVQERAASTVE